MACKNCENMRLALAQALKERDEANHRAAEALMKAEAGISHPTDEERKSKLLYILTGETR